MMSPKCEEYYPICIGEVRYSLPIINVEFDKQEEISNLLILKFPLNINIGSLVVMFNV